MPWNLEGSYFESCSCDTPCPCTVSLSFGADQDFCRVVLVFNIKSGDVDGVDVGGLGAAMFCDTPKQMTEGNWTVGLWLDDKASDEQAEALGKVFSGELGGPPAALAPLLGDFRGVERAPFEFEEEGLRHSVKICDVAVVDIEDVVPFGVEDGQPAKLVGIWHPAGTTLVISKANEAHAKGFGFEYEGHAGFSNPEFAWAG
jgi:hypothetical protein